MKLIGIFIVLFTLTNCSSKETKSSFKSFGIIDQRARVKLYDSSFISTHRFSFLITYLDKHVYLTRCNNSKLKHTELKFDSKKCERLLRGFQEQVFQHPNESKQRPPKGCNLVDGYCLDHTRNPNFSQLSSYDLAYFVTKVNLTAFEKKLNDDSSKEKLDAVFYEMNSKAWDYVMSENYHYPHIVEKYVKFKSN